MIDTAIYFLFLFVVLIPFMVLFAMAGTIIYIAVSVLVWAIRDEIRGRGYNSSREQSPEKYAHNNPWDANVLPKIVQKTGR